MTDAIRPVALMALLLAPLPALPPGAVAAQGFTTPDEVRPILAATRAQWVALREWEGRDLLYFTQLAAWRCGFAEARYSVNGGPEGVFEMEPCYLDSAQPNAVRGEPWVSFGLGEVEKVRVVVDFGDGTGDEVEVTRREILMP